jgi:hypothetical protein
MNTSELPRHGGNFWAAAWECWYGASDRACTVTAYTWKLSKAIVELMGAIAFWVYAYTKVWVDAQVEAAEVKPEEAAEVLTVVSPFASLTFFEWVLVVVFKVRAMTLRLLLPTQTVASNPGAPQLQPCL